LVGKIQKKRFSSHSDHNVNVLAADNSKRMSGTYGSFEQNTFATQKSRPTKKKDKHKKKKKKKKKVLY
jgi:hypothetical protein